MDAIRSCCCFAAAIGWTRTIAAAPPRTSIGPSRWPRTTRPHSGRPVSRGSAPAIAPARDAPSSVRWRSTPRSRRSANFCQHSIADAGGHMRTLVVAAAIIFLVVAPGFAQPSREHLDAMRHLRLGQENMHAEQWDKAEAEFQSAIKLEPTLEMAHYGLGQVYMATKRYPEAVRAYLACRGAFESNTARRATNDLDAQRALDDQIRSLEDEKTLLVSGRVKAMTSGAPIDLDRRISDLKARRFHESK